MGIRETLLRSLSASGPTAPIILRYPTETGKGKLTRVAFRPVLEAAGSRRVWEATHDTSHTRPCPGPPTRSLGHGGLRNLRLGADGERRAGGDRQALRAGNRRTGRDLLRQRTQRGRWIRRCATLGLAGPRRRPALVGRSRAAF